MKLNEREPYQNNIIRKGLEWNWFVAQLLSALIKQKHSLLLSFSPFAYSQIAIDFCSTSLSQRNGTNTTPFSPYQGDGRKKRADGGNLRLCAHKLATAIGISLTKLFITIISLWANKSIILFLSIVFFVYLCSATTSINILKDNSTISTILC